MKKYIVYGHTVVNVTKEVWANNESEAYDKARDELSSLIAYCGNGGYDKLIGVDGSDESVDAVDDIEYDDIKFVEDNPDYQECPECGEECERKADDDGNEYWECPECGLTFDDDGNEVCVEEKDNEG